MQTNYLQSMLAFNARNITAVQELIKYSVDSARYERARGETAFMIAKFDAAKKLRKQLAKLVANQCVMLVELKANYREARISRKLNKLEGRCPIPLRRRDMTSYEYEALLDRITGAWQQNNSDEQAKSA